MNLVLDASVAAKWLLAEVDSDKAQALFRAWEAKRIELLAPEILPVEVGSTLWKRVMRGLLPLKLAVTLHHEFRALRIPLQPVGDLVDAACDLALRYRHSVYDGLYVALSHRTGADFITADEKLFNLIGPKRALLLRDWK